MSQSLAYQSLLEKFDVGSDDLSLLQECGQRLADKIDTVVDQFYEWLGRQPEFNMFFSSQDTVERVKRLQKVYWVDFFSGVVDQRYIDYRVHIGEIHAQRDMPNLIYFAAMLRFQLLFTNEIQNCGIAKNQVQPTTRAFTKLSMLDTYVTSDQIAQFAKRRVVDSGKAILAMSTPVTSIWEGGSLAAPGWRCRFAAHARHHGEDIVAHRREPRARLRHGHQRRRDRRHCCGKQLHQDHAGHEVDGMRLHHLRDLPERGADPGRAWRECG